MEASKVFRPQVLVENCYYLKNSHVPLSFSPLCGLGLILDLPIETTQNAKTNEWNVNPEQRTVIMWSRVQYFSELTLPLYERPGVRFGKQKIATSCSGTLNLEIGSEETNHCNVVTPRNEYKIVTTGMRCIEKSARKAQKCRLTGINTAKT